MKPKSRFFYKGMCITFTLKNSCYCCLLCPKGQFVAIELLSNLRFVGFCFVLFQLHWDETERLLLLKNLLYPMLLQRTLFCLHDTILNYVPLTDYCGGDSMARSTKAISLATSKFIWPFELKKESDNTFAFLWDYIYLRSRVIRKSFVVVATSWTMFLLFVSSSSGSFVSFSTLSFTLKEAVQKLLVSFGSCRNDSAKNFFDDTMMRFSRRSAISACLYFPRG